MNDPVLYWNEILLVANARDHTDKRTPDVRYPSVDTRGPTGTSRAFAIVHLAIADAVAAVAGKATYTGVTGYTGPTTPQAQSAAVSAAAQCTLTALWPQYEALFTEHSVKESMTGAGLDDGHRLGVQIALALLDSRTGDGAANQPHYASSSAYGRHRGDPVNPGQQALGPLWGNVDHFVLPARIPLDPPPGYAQADYLTDADYLADHQEVRDLGRLGSPNRTPEQTLIGVYWAYDGPPGLGTPPRLYNQILREIADRMGNTVEENAEFFALANAAMADAGIEAWHWKFEYNLWRPVVGVREAAKTNGPSGAGTAATSQECDPFWRPLGAPLSNQREKPDFTPPFPAYPSGHATFGAAVFQAVQLYYGGDPITLEQVLGGPAPTTPAIDVEFVSDELNGVTTGSDGVVRTRHVRRFTDLATPIRENALSRVYLGVHWRFDGVPRNAGRNVGGVPLGLAVGRTAWQAMGCPTAASATSSTA